MRKALVVGINSYPSAPLRGCINDASAFAAIIATDGDGARNFDVRLHTDVPTKDALRGLIVELFSGRHEIALLYFSGHGFEDKLGVHLVTPDAKRNDAGISMDELLLIANRSESENRVIILDCCHAGALGTPGITGGEAAHIHQGVTILTASKSDESAVEVNGHGIFTNLLIEALQGGAADLNGCITPGSIYAYIDQALGAWYQRPVFKTNITQFACLRRVPTPVPPDILRKLADYFPSPEKEYALDPSYEHTNDEHVKPLLVQPYAIPENVAVFKNLQKFLSVGLVTPVGTPHLYFAAMESRSCRLTALGYHYWRLVKEHRI